MLALCLLTIIGAVLRTFQIGFNSLWLDEASTLTIAKLSVVEILLNMTTGEFNPPLFYLIEHFMLAFGNTEAILRFMPAVFGILTIPVIYLVGKEFVDKYTGLIIAGIFTFSPFLVFYSQEARAYSLMLLLCAGMMFFYLRAIKTNEIRDWMLFAVLAAAAFWSHFYSGVFFFALLSYAVIMNRAYIKLQLLAFVGWVILSLPILLAMIYLIQVRTKTAPTYGYQGITVIVETFRQMNWFNDIMVIICFLLLFVGLYWAFTNAYTHGIMICWLIAVSCGLSVILSFVIPMLPRYLIFIAIPFYLGVAIAYLPIKSLFTEDIKAEAVTMIFIVFFGMMSAPFFIQYYQGYTKENWRGIAQDLTAITNDGDVVIAVPDYIIQPLGYYYNNTSDKTAFGGLSSMEGLALAKQAIQNTTYYVVTPDLMAVDPNMRAATWLMENTFVVADYPGVTIMRGYPNV